jgi:hypothetical protein
MQQSLNVMLPYVKAQLSLLNTVVELKDFKSLPKTLNSMASFAVRRRETLRQTLRAASDGYLQAKFNILPLLSDISGIRTALLRTERRINDLVTRSGRVQRRHFAFNWYEHTDTTTTNQATQSNPAFFSAFFAPLSSSSGPFGVTVKLTRYVSYIPSVFHAEIEYNYNYTQYQLVHAQALGLLDALGVNLNPAIIWNAIPWSFVIDWVVNVSSFLNKWRESNMAPTINIRRYLWSVKRERTILVTKQVLDPSGTYPIAKRSIIPLPVVHQTAYRRGVGLPTSGSVVLSGLNLNEFSLGAALVLSRRRRHRNR